MRVMIVGDNNAVIAQIQAAVVRSGFECRQADIAPCDQAPARTSAVRRDFTVLAMSSEQGKSLDTLLEIRNTVQSPIVAVGPADDPKYILQSLRNGADVYVDEREIDQELDGAIASLKSKQPPEHDGGTVVGILSPSGGNGSSTVAVNLASALVQGSLETRAALLDLRFTAGDQSLLLDLKPTHSIADLCRNCTRLDQSMFQQCLTRHSSGISLLAAPEKISETLAISPQGVRQAVAMARAAFPFVIMDLDRSLAVEQRAAIVLCDVILLALQLNIASLNNARRVIELLNEMGMSSQRVKLTVNKYGQPKELPVRTVEKALGLELYHAIPNDPANMNLSVNKGVPVVLECPRSKPAKSFRKLAKQLSATVGDNVSNSPSPSQRPPLRVVAAQTM